MRTPAADGHGGVRVAVVQADVERRRVDRNLERAHRAIETAARRGASLVVFPEMYLTGYEVLPHLAQLSLTPASPALRTVAADARRYRIGVLIGYPERRSDGFYNSVSFIGPDGTVLATYRKIHLFDREREYFRPGHRHRLVRFGSLNVGLLICYDLEFPEPSRVLALGGADLIAVSTANMEPYRESQGVYVRSRALENHVFVALANRIGVEGRTRFVGGSGVWDPFGNPLTAADKEEHVFVATIHPSVRRRARARFDYLAERRPETYRSVR